MEELLRDLAEKIFCLLNRIGVEITFKAVYYSLIIISISLVPIVAAFYKLLKWRKNRIIQRDLHPHFIAEDVQNSVKYYVRTKYQYKSPLLEQEPGETFAYSDAYPLVPFFLKRFSIGESHYYIVLGDSGMGKSSFLINLYRLYIEKYFKRYNIRLYSLNNNRFENEIKQMTIEEKKKTVLLLDAFDEDPNAIKDHVGRMRELIDLTYYFRKIIVTCRTQFFPNEKSEPDEIHIPKAGTDKGNHRFQKLYISPFSDKDIRNYLFKKYWFRPLDFLDAYKVVKSCSKLMARPLLLRFIGDLVESKQRFKYSYEIYDHVINRWIDRESKRIDQEKRNQFQSDMYHFSSVIAIRIYQEPELLIEEQFLVEIAKTCNIELPDMKGRSLLTRDGIGRYKFAHKSILEFFLARKYFEDPQYVDVINFKGFSNALKFYKEQCHMELLNHFNHIVDGDNLTCLDSLELRKENLHLINSLKLKTRDSRVLKLLSGFTNLNKLDASDLNLTSDEIEYFKTLTGLQELDLSNNKISEIRSFAELTLLTDLNLIGNPLSYQIDSKTWPSNLKILNVDLWYEDVREFFDCSIEAPSQVELLFERMKEDLGWFEKYNYEGGLMQLFYGYSLSNNESGSKTLSLNGNGELINLKKLIFGLVKKFGADINGKQELSLEEFDRGSNIERLWKLSGKISKVQLMRLEQLKFIIEIEPDTL